MSGAAGAVAAFSRGHALAPAESRYRAGHFREDGRCVLGVIPHVESALELRPADVFSMPYVYSCTVIRTIPY